MVEGLIDILSEKLGDGKRIHINGLDVYKRQVYGSVSLPTCAHDARGFAKLIHEGILSRKVSLINHEPDTEG